jgi:hypothetical protein
MTELLVYLPYRRRSSSRPDGLGEVGRYLEESATGGKLAHCIATGRPISFCALRSRLTTGLPSQGFVKPFWRIDISRA